MLESWSSTFPRWEAYDDCKSVYHCVNDRIDPTAPGVFFEKFLKEFGRACLFNSRFMPEATVNRHFKHLGNIYHALCLALVFCTFRVTIIFGSRSIVFSKSCCVADKKCLIRLFDVCVYQLLTLILYMLLLLPFCRAGSHPLDNHAHRLQLDRGRRKLHAVHWPQFCNIFIWELMKLVVKPREEQEQSGVYAQCLTTTPAAKQKIHWCLCPMRGSIVYAVPKA